MSSFCANYSCKPVLNGSIRLLHMSLPIVQDYVQSMQDSFGVISEELKAANNSAKYSADKRWRDKKFQVGDKVC